LSAITVCILVAAGHFGGSLTHGEDYLLPQKKTAAVKTGQVADSVQSMAAPQMRSLSGTSEAAAPDAKIASKTATQTAAQKIFVYRDVVTPILEKKCYSCHSASKMKGGLRLDSEAFIKKGSKNGSIYTPGNPEKSILFSNLLLPEDDDLHMPPKGKPQLTTQEIATIHFWIKKGASFEAFVEATASETSNPASIARLSKTLTNEGAETADLKPENTGRRRLQNIEAKILENNTEAAPPAALTKLKQQDIIISNLGEGSNYLTANFVNVKNYRSALIDDLSSVDDQLISVKLSGQPVTDDDVKKLSLLKNLVRLNLEKTAITDAALAHLKNLPNLQYLNLYGTIVTDKGLSALAKCPNLKVVYLWQTKTTPAGVRQLRKSLPNIRVESGDFQFAKRDTSKI
jgi:Planctomycete cytochrome C